MKNYYQILGVERNATLEDIKKAYRALALEYHPDKNSSSYAATKFINATEAYEILKNPEKRKYYDKSYFTNNEIAEEFTNWQKDAQQKGAEYSRMDFELFNDRIIKELKIVAKHSAGFGCLITLGVMVIGAIYASFTLLTKSNADIQVMAILSVLFWIGLFIFFYIRIMGAYKDDRKG